MALSLSPAFLSPSPRMEPSRSRTRDFFMGRAFCALAIFAALMASTTPSPLYPVYIAEWGLPQSAGTTIFAVYAIGTLLSLFLAGWLDRLASDRRQILLPALVFTMLGALMFAAADEVWMLLVGRFLSGASTGLITSTASTAIFELDSEEKRGRAATVSTVAFTGGAASGPCLSSAALAAGVAPLVTPFLCIAALALVAFVGLSLAPWPKGRNPAASSARKPSEIRPDLSDGDRARYLALACLSVAVAWMLGSMLMAASVSLATELFHLQVYALAGLLPALFQLAGGIGQVLAGRIQPLRAILLGCGLLAVLQLGTLAGAWAGITAVFILAMPLCGLAYGAAFVGGASLVNRTAAQGTLARKIARFYVVGYLSNSIPTFAFGLMIDSHGLATAFTVFSLVFVLLALTGTVIAASWIRKGGAGA
ncbi:MAG: MFS transporter [Rhodobacteraceae bacterium]|nr:MFS transporter [Paracoccaceae bacterium]